MLSDFFFYILVTTEIEMNKFKHFKNNFPGKRLEIMATVWRDFSGAH